MVEGGRCEMRRRKERELKFRVLCSVTVLQNSECVGYSSGLSSATLEAGEMNGLKKKKRAECLVCCFTMKYEAKFLLGSW
jgi:hypothetical protein